MEILSEINECYWNIFPFESMFYDFVEHISWPKYIAGVELIQQVADEEENRISAKISNLQESGSIISKNATGNDGRMRIKRIYAVFANKQLRKKYFDF